MVQKYKWNSLQVSPLGGLELGREKEWEGILGKDRVVFNRPLGVGWGVPDGRFAQGCISDAEDTKLRGHPVKVGADAVEVKVRGASGQGRGDCVLRCGVVRHRFLTRIQQDGVDVRQFAEHSEEGREFGSPACANGT